MTALTKNTIWVVRSVQSVLHQTGLDRDRADAISYRIAAFIEQHWDRLRARYTDQGMDEFDMVEQATRELLARARVYSIPGR